MQHSPSFQLTQSLTPRTFPQKSSCALWRMPRCAGSAGPGYPCSITRGYQGGLAGGAPGGQTGRSDVPASRCQPTGPELDQYAWFLSTQVSVPLGWAPAAQISQDEQMQKLGSPMSPQGHVFKSLTQGPRGQSTQHVENLSGSATVWALGDMPRSHSDRRTHAQSYGSVGKEVRREDGRKDWALTEPHPTGNLHSTVACIH